MQCFIVGAPGTGKTVVAAHLASKLNIEHINYRDLVIGFAKGRSRAAKKIQKLRVDSEPFPTQNAFKILKDYLEKTGVADFVLDGYPKTADEAKRLVSWLQKQPEKTRLTFFFDAKKEEVFERLVQRMVCPTCSYVAFNPNPNNILDNECPNCHLPLIQRQDDNDQRISHRFDRYLKNRKGIIEEMEKVSETCFINSSQSLAAVISEVVEKVVGESEDTKAERGARVLVEGLGLNLADPNILGTPIRITKTLKEMMRGIRPDAQEEIKKHLATVFPTKYKGMIILEPIKCVSLCSHHLMPISYEVLFGYIPKDKSLGFSKVIKVINLIAAKPTLQEDFTQEVIETFQKVLEPEGIMIVVRGRHSCMSLRGEKSENINITSALRGMFKDEQRTRDEFLSLAKFK